MKNKNLQKKNKTHIYDLAIIGGGITGLSAGVYSGRLNLDTALFCKERFGTIAKTNNIENYPGFKKISGMELGNKVLEQAKQYPLNIFEKEVTKIAYSKKGCFRVYYKDRSEIHHVHAQNILFATGTEWRKLKVPGEAEFANKGVHYCALCDAPFYKGKVVAVAGGGDSAAKEAILLSGYAKKVYIIAKNKLKPEPINKKRIEKRKNIEIIEGNEIKKIIGKQFVTEIQINKQYNKSNKIKVDGIFVDIGHIPLSKFAKPLGVKLDKKQQIIINKESRTNIKGIWAAGDVTDTRFKQAITGVGEAVKAIYGIYERVTGEKILCSCVDQNC
jgi:thioredoxin-disulfide reductase